MFLVASAAAGTAAAVDDAVVATAAAAVTSLADAVFDHRRHTAHQQLLR